MANPHTGEVEFKAGNETYKISFSADALAEMESALGKTLNEIVALFQQPDKLRVADMRIMFWKGLCDHREMTFEEARAILKKMKPTEMATLVGKAFVLSMPDADEEAPNPPKPGSQKDGTGPAS